MANPKTQPQSALVGAAFRLGLTALLAASTSTNAWSGESAKQQAGVRAPVIVEGDNEIKVLWDHLFAAGDRDKVMASYDVVNALNDGEGDLTPEDCRKQAAALDDAMRDNPVGLAVWYVAYLCAQQTGDQEAAARRLQRFEALVKYGIDSLPPDHGLTPIRVLSPIDANVFIAASGQQVLYKVYDPYQNDRYLMLRVGLWDAERKRERWLSFDYLDSFFRLSQGRKYFEFPYFRHQLAFVYLKKFSTNDPAAKAALDLQDALVMSDPVKRVATISDLASGGNFEAAMTLAYLCSADETTHCETQAIDALLPFAEKHYAQAMIALARFYAEGRGVEQDQKAAQKLIASANDRLGEGWGTLLFAVSSLEAHHKTMSPTVRADLEALARHGNPTAETVLAAFAVADSKGAALPRDIVDRLRDAASRGIALAQSTLGGVLLTQGKAEDGVAWLESAADLDSTIAQSALGKIYESGLAEARIKPDVPQAMRWYAQAGTGGDVQSMLWMGRHYLTQPDTEENRFQARGWLKSATIKGNLDGALALAQVYRRGNGGDEGSPTDAIKIYQSLSETENSASARRAWADMLQRGDGVPKDLAEARRLLAVDANRGDPVSQYELGSMLIAGEEGKDAIAEGMQWIRKSADQGNAAAEYSLAVALEEGQRIPPDAAQAIKYYQYAVAKGDVDAMLRLANVAAAGRGMGKDPLLADKLLRQAAAKGNSEAMWRLGDAFMYGQGEPKDRAQAIDWYTKSAQAGDRAGMRGLGAALLEDDDAKLKSEGIEWLQRAASAGNDVAMNDLGIAFENGMGVAKDYAQAASWFEKGDQAGNSDAMTNLGFLKLNGLGGPVHPVDARNLFEKASKLGNAAATCDLANMLIEGRGGPADSTRAWTLMQQGADAGNAMCQLTLGLGYRYNRVTGKEDIPNAEKYLQLADKQGVEEARAQLAEITLKQHPDDEAQQREAIKTLTILAAANSSRAQFLLGEACTLGTPWPRDGVCARENFEKAASHGFPAAASNLGLFLESGFGGAQDLDAAEKWFRKAIDAGAKQSYYELGRLLLHKGSDSEAIHDLLISATSHDNSGAAYVLLRYCRAHPDCGVPQKDRRAMAQKAEQMTAGGRNNLAWGLAVDVMSDADDGRYAVKLMEPLLIEGSLKWAELDTLAAAYARAGDYDRAVEMQQRTLDAMPETTSRHQRAMMTERLERYRSRKTWDIPY